MRRGTYENHWDTGPENWVNHNPRFSRGNRRANFHGYNTRVPNPRHWRPDGGFRPRVPVWNTQQQTPQQFSSHGVRPPMQPPSGPVPGSYFWPPVPGQPPGLLQTPPEYQDEKDKPKSNQSFGLPCDNINETINTVKQKLRERKVSETNTEFVGDPSLEYSDDNVATKASERRRIEHAKLPKKQISTKKSDSKELNTAKVTKATNPQHSPTNIYQRKSEVMRRKILKQLFKMDKETLRKMLSQPISSNKYDFALNSLIKETRSSISNQLRNVAEKSLRLHETNADSLQGKQIVQDAFMGHLGSMLDTDASVELSNMEPQVIAELSKVLQEDLMGTLNEEMSVRSLASAMQDSVAEDISSNYSNYLNDMQSREGNFKNNSYSYDSINTCVAADLDAFINPNVRFNESNRNSAYSNDTQHSENYGDTSDIDYRPSWDDNPLEFKVDPTAFCSEEDNTKYCSNLYSNSNRRMITDDVNCKNINTRRNEEFRSSKSFPKINTDTKLVPSAVDQITKEKSHYNPYKGPVDRITEHVNKSDNNISSLRSQDQLNNIDQKTVTRESVEGKPTDLIDSSQHSRSPQNATGNANVSSNKNCSNQINKTLDSSNFTDARSPSSVTSADSEIHSNMNENSINLLLKEKANKLRKRKKSNSFLDQSNKKPDLSDHSIISVRKDMFPNCEPASSDSKILDSPKSNDKGDTFIDQNKISRSVGTSTTTSSQTVCNKVVTKSQGSQYHIKNSDTSTQVYESLISSKSKGTQCFKLNSRDRSCQTLKLDALLTSANSSELNSVSNFTNRETQTEEPIKRERITESIDRESLKSSRISKPMDKLKTIDLHSKEDVLERMRQIDNDIYLLMQEKLKLYGRLDMPSSAEPNSTSNDNLTKNKHTDKLRFHKYKNEFQKKNPSKPYEMIGLKTNSLENLKIPKLRSSREKLPPAENYQNHHKRSAPQTEHHKSKETNSKHKHDNNEHRNKTSAVSVSKSKTRTEVAKSDGLTSKHSAKKDEAENNACSYSNIIPGKDINNGKVDVTKGKLTSYNCDQSVEYNTYVSLDVNSDSKYVDSAGCPVTPDCSLVVSEEVVIKSESDVSDQPGSTDCASVNKYRKKSDSGRKEKTLRSGNNNCKLDKSDCDKVAIKDIKTKLPPTIPAIKIRKRRTTSGTSQTRTKSSPLFNLISQLNDTDEECDFEISNPQKSIKSPQASIDSVELENISNHVSDQVLTADGSSNENLKYDLVDCRVYLERLDADKLVSGTADKKLPPDSCNMTTKVCTSSMIHENFHSTIINDETLFNTKGYSNDDDCISLEQLDAVQFDDFCDPDVPSIIGNIEVNDSFSIIDQWDSKLFENVSLLEDREIFSGKDLLDSIDSDMSTLVKSHVVPKVNESAVSEAINFTSHSDSIIALKCVGENFLAASLDGNVYYYCGSKKKILQTISVSKLAVTCLAIKPNRTPSQVYTGSHDSFLRCFNFKTGEKIFEDVDVGGPIQSMFQEWKTLYIGTQSGFVVKFDIEKGSLFPEKTIKFSDNAILALHAIKEGPRKVLLIASRSQEVTVKDASTGLLLRSFHGPNNTVYSLLFDSGKVYCGTSGPDVQVFDFVTGDLVELHKGGRGAVCLQMYKGLLFSGCYDGMIYVFKKSNCENPVARIPGPGKMLLAMAIVNNKIIAGCKDKTLSIWPLPKEVTNLLDS